MTEKRPSKIKTEEDKLLEALKETHRTAEIFAALDAKEKRKKEADTPPIFPEGTEESLLSGPEVTLGSLVPENEKPKRAEEAGWEFADLPKEERGQEPGMNDFPEGEEIEAKNEKEKEIEAEIKNLPEEEKEKIGWGLNTIGFKVEEMKNVFFAFAFDPNTMWGLKKGGLQEKFYKELRDSFIRDADEARKKAQEVKSGKERHILANAGLAVGNVLKYGRIVADITGASIANPFRYVMAGGMAIARFSEAGKEVRLKSEAVMEKTKIADIKKAEEEAWYIYKNAEKKEGEGKVSRKGLEKAYFENLPQDLLERLKNPSTANKFIQMIVEKQVKFSINKLNKKINEIENDENLFEEDKNKNKEKLLKKWESNLRDYDRLITQYGTVDQLGMWLRYAQKTGKGVVFGMQIETAVVSVEKLIENIHHIFSSQEIMHELEIRPSGVESTHPVTPPVAEETVVKPETLIRPETDAIIHRGEGVEHAFRRQIEHNEELAKALGFKGDVHNADELHKFSGGAAHRLAIQKGYVDTTGQNQIGVVEADKVAYEVKLENGKVVVAEKDLTGKIFNKIEDRGIFGETKENPYDKVFDTSAQENTVTPETLSVEITESPEETIRPETDTGTEKIEETNIEIVEPETKEIPNEPNPEIRIIHEDALRREILEKYGGNEPTENLTSLSTEQQNIFILSHPEFATDQYHLGVEKLIETYDASQKNLYFLFGNNSQFIWKELKNVPADKILGQTEGNSSILRLGQYLSLLKNFSGLEPENNLAKTESAETYIARALQKLTSEGKLETFQDSLRK